ncbi:MAG: hypothetical protein R3B72_49405 [Polyangiaceae bacterium]
MTGHASHHGVATHARAGGAADDLRVGIPPRQVLKLHGLTHLAPEPGLLLVSLRYIRKTVLTGRFAVYARLHWTTGKAVFVAEIDVPAHGTSVAVAGADGLEVAMGVEGDEQDAAARGEAIASWVQAAHPRPAQRTVWVPPDELATPRRIPDFARSVRLVASDPVTLTYEAIPEGGVAVATAPLFPEGAPLAVPPGAHAFRLAPLAPDPSPTLPLALVWELSL